MIKVYYNRLENDKIEMTQDMLTDILSYTKRQDKYIKRLKEEYVMLQNASDEVEEELQQRIDKAIEYIEQQRLHKFQDTTGGLTYKERKLLGILEGVDKE